MIKKESYFVEPFFVQAIANRISFKIAFDESGIFKFFQVLRNGRLGEWQLIYDIATNTTVYFYKVFYNGNTRRMAYGFCQSSHFVLCVGKVFGFSRSHRYIFILQYYDKQKLKSSKRDYLT